METNNEHFQGPSDTMLQTLVAETNERSIPPRIVVVQEDNPHHCYFAVNVEICNATGWSFHRPFRGLVNNDSGDMLIPITYNLFHWLLQIRGIEVVEVHPYRVGVRKTPAVEWEEIHMPILSTISKLVYPDAENESIQVWFEPGTDHDHEDEASCPAEGDDHAAA